MKDLSEVANGHSRIHAALFSDSRIDRLRSALDAILPSQPISTQILSLVGDDTAPLT